MKCSVIINTYNRAQHLRRLLAGLGHLRDTTFEIVVVNGPSTDETECVLEEYKGRIKTVTCPTRNLSQSRNLGIEAAAGDILVFIDDDALPDDDLWLARYEKAFSSDSDGSLGAAGGSIMHCDTDLMEFNSGATSDYGMQVFDNSSLPLMKVDGQRWIQGVPGGNSALLRKALVEIGGFDEFYAYYLDETDVCVRLGRAGYRIAHLPENKIRHYKAVVDCGTGPFMRNWDVITRSDTYFALKNGADPLPLRILKTLRYARRKHYFREINTYRLKGEITRKQWIRLMRQWASGLTAGLWAGLFRARQCRKFSSEPPTFMPFVGLSAEKRLRVALLSQTVPHQPGIGGIGRYTYDLAHGLHERGHEVHIFCKDEQPLLHKNLHFEIHGISPEKHAFNVVAGDFPVLNKNLSHSLALADALGEMYLNGVEFDVVHASNWDEEAIAFIRGGQYPVVLMLVTPLTQVIIAEGWEFNEDLRACAALDKWQIEHADAICVPSEGVLSSYEESMGLRQDLIPYLRTVPLGIVPKSCRSEAGSGDRRHLLFVGRCERRKGVHTLLSVLPQLLVEFPEWECHLVGNDQIPLAEGGTLKEQFLARHRGKPWLERVFFHGIVAEEELNRQYRICDLFVAPSLFESFGLIYHEAMRYGKAVIGCRTSGVPEVVEHGIEGLLVTPGSPDELHEALERLMRGDNLRQRMGKAGAERVNRKMNYRTMAEGMEKVYFETISLVGKKRRERRERLWPRELPIFTSSEQVRFVGDWEIEKGIDGRCRYLRGRPRATVSFEAVGGTVMRIEAVRHNRSGILQILVGDETLRYVDLYRYDGTEPNYMLSIPLPVNDGVVTVTLRIHTERNPESYASGVWLSKIFAVSPKETA